MNGADAVYFGSSAFNARARASNFAPEELPEVMEYLRSRGVKGFMTLNVLVFDDELEQVESLVEAAARAGVDALIVQDLGVVELIRRKAPHLPIHGSTQMTITSGEGAEFVRQRGVSRVVLARELSVKDILRARRQTDAELEVFVHGAMCVSYSGQCFSSEAWGGRSANRGICAQGCRQPYALILDGLLKEMGDLNYLLSPQDLCGLEALPQLVEAGVSCLKIEGRLKGPEYVAMTTQVYRKAVDAAWQEVAAASHAAAEGLPAGRQRAVSEQDMDDLKQMFARGQDAAYEGLTPGWLNGVRHQQLVRGRAPHHRGLLVGEVVDVTSRGVWVYAKKPIKRGDGLVFDQGHPQGEEEGGTVYDVMDARQRSVGARDQASGRKGRVLLTFLDHSVRTARLHVGDLVWRNRDAALEARVRATFEKLPSEKMRRLAIAVQLAGRVGEVLMVRVEDEDGNVGVGSSTQCLEPAAKRPLDEAVLRKAVGLTLGADTSLRMKSLDLAALELQAGLFLGMAEIRNARRRAVEDLMRCRNRHGIDRDLKDDERVLHGLLQECYSEASSSLPVWSTGTRSAESTGGPRLRVLCRAHAQVEAALQVEWLEEVVLDFLEVQGLRQSVQQVRSSGRRVVVATPRVLKPDEERLVQFYLQLQADALLIRSTGLLHQLAEMGGPGSRVRVGNEELRIPALHGDFSLNAANSVSAALLLGTGLERLTLTHDCNAQQHELVARGLGPGAAPRLEAILHLHLPIFHTEHCVFCRFLSEGDNFTNCGHPCEQHTVHLRDGNSHDHLVLADMGCRNTVFNAQSQTAALFARGLQDAGFQHFRVELVDEPEHLVVPLLNAYRDLLLGEKRPAQLLHWLEKLPDANGLQQGCTSGSMQPRRELDRSMLKPTARGH